MADPVLVQWLDQLDEAALYTVVQGFVLDASEKQGVDCCEFEEFALIQHLEASGIFKGLESLPAALLIFTKHFYVRRALYALRSTLAERGLRVEFDLMRFRLHQLNQSGNARQLKPAAEQLLADFYGNVSTLKAATNDSVAKMMADFWLAYDGYMQGGHHLQVLGLSAGSSKAQIKSAYRRLAATHHPDKGGSAERFAEIRQAYEALMRIH